MSEFAPPPAIESLFAAIERALDDTPHAEVLAVLAGAFLSLTIELVRRQGLEVNSEIKIDGGPQRDITIHAPKDAI